MMIKDLEEEGNGFVLLLARIFDHDQIWYERKWYVETTRARSTVLAKILGKSCFLNF